MFRSYLDNSIVDPHVFEAQCNHIHAQHKAAKPVLYNDLRDLLIVESAFFKGGTPG
jgi:hypothetical protein